MIDSKLSHRRVSLGDAQRTTCAWILALLVAFGATLCRAQPGPDYERWYAIEMQGQRAGWAMSSQATEGDHVTSRQVTRLEIRRGEITIAVSMEGEFVETLAGKPVSMRTVQQFGAAPTTLEATFGEQGVETTIRTGGRADRSTQPSPEGTWLTPAAAGNYVKQRLAAGAERVEVRTIEPAGGLSPLDALKPVVVARSALTPVTIEVMGKTVEATRCISETSSQPGLQSTEWLDADGVPIRVESALGGIKLVMSAAEKTEATSRVRAPELMVSTFVKPNRPIREPRESRRGVYTVSITDGALPAMPKTGVQRIERIDARSARVIVDLESPAAADESDLANAEFRQPSLMVGSADPEVVSLATRATVDAGSAPAARAEAMRRFVHTYIRAKGLDVGFAGAGEVARTRAGDCTEHAALLAAMLRADGIPSRVAAGLIYADRFAGERDIFGYHMWTQALLRDGDGNGGRWVDLDATLPDAPMDATHIALGVSPLADGQVQDVFVSLATILGRLSITVEEAE